MDYVSDYYSTLDCSKRNEAIERAEKFIADNNIQYIYMQFISLTGRLVGKGIPAKHFPKMLRTGYTTVMGATVNVALDRRGDYLGYPPNASVLLALPDPTTLVKLPWAPTVARVFCSLFRNLEETINPGARLETDCRGNLENSHNWFRQQTGLTMSLGVEPEMMWLKKDNSPLGLTGASSPNCYHIAQFEQLRPVLLRVLEYAQKMGLDLIQGDHEDAPGQLELNFLHDDVLATCDRLITYRQICNQVASEFDLVACFIPKPFQGMSASSTHFNISLWQDNQGHYVRELDHHNQGMEEVFSYFKGETNRTRSENGLREPNDITRYSIAGLLDHLPALTAVASSTVNSYRRLWDTGFWAPIQANWGYQNRTCAIRIPSNDRIEYRSPDSIVNPYLMGSCILHAIEDGLSKKAEPVPPTELDSYEEKTTDIPMTLDASLTALNSDEKIKQALKGDMLRVYNEVKRDEWERYLSHVSSWDIETYMDYTP